MGTPVCTPAHATSFRRSAPVCGEARTAAGPSQEALAHQAGLHRTYVSSVERGERNIALVNIVALAITLNIDAGTLVGGLGDPH